MSGDTLLAYQAAAMSPAGILATWGFAQGWPGFDVLYRIPGLNFGAPNRILALQWLLLPWLAALGAQGLRRGERSVRTRARDGA